MNDIHDIGSEGAVELTPIDREALEALAEEGHGLLPEGADMERLQRLGLATKLGITWGLTPQGRTRLADEA